MNSGSIKTRTYMVQVLELALDLLYALSVDLTLERANEDVDGSNLV